MTAGIADDAITARNATLQDAVALLRRQQARKVDVIAPARAIRAEGGLLVLDETVPQIGVDGVTMTSGRYRPTDVCDHGIADKLGIPSTYLRKTREAHPAPFDANVNGWLDRDDRAFLVRCLRDEDGGTGVARAWLSDSYKVIDNLDVLTAAVDGIRASGYPVSIDACDLTDRRMYVRVRCEPVQVLAPALLAGYKSVRPARRPGRGDETRCQALQLVDAQRALLGGASGRGGGSHSAVLLPVRGSYSDFLIGEA
jgi:hypothetical protein